MMDCLIQEAHDFTAVYLNDLVIYSTIWEDHLYHLWTVLLKLHKAGLTAKPTKQMSVHAAVCLFRIYSERWYTRTRSW